MKLIQKIQIIFLITLIILLPVIYFALPAVLMNVAVKQMEKQAKTFGLFLLKNIEEISSLQKDPDDIKTRIDFENLVYNEFEKAINIAKESDSFLVDEIILIKPDYRVEVGYPAEQKDLDYKSHRDIVENFKEKKFNIVIEKESINGKNERDIDIVSYLTVLNKNSRVLEIKLNFKKTIVIINNQFKIFKIISVLSAFFLITGVMFILLYFFRKTIVDPAVSISAAMEKVGQGDLEQKLDKVTNDELGLISQRFNDMVRGLKEKLHLSKYVSKSTMEAVQSAVSNGKSFHTPLRKVVTVFFSDIRGFTAYSEKKDPAYIINMLNKILSVQVKIIRKYGGDIDKFVGDETMAVFNDPLKAIIAALEIQKILEINKAKLDNLRLGIGILEGEVVEGDVGYDEMKDFTVIGSIVNTASRLQSAASGGEILITKSLKDKKEIIDSFKMEYKDKIKFKGMDDDTELYKVRGMIKRI